MAKTINVIIGECILCTCQHKLILTISSISQPSSCNEGHTSSIKCAAVPPPYSMIYSFTNKFTEFQFNKKKKLQVRWDEMCYQSVDCNGTFSYNWWQTNEFVLILKRGERREKKVKTGFRKINLNKFVNYNHKINGL